MFSSKAFSRLLSLSFLAIIFVVLGSCSSGGDSTSSVTPGGTGTVALLLTDAPSDIFEEVNITVVKAELLSDSGSVTIFDGEETFNLLDLTDVEIFAIREGVAAGTYSKIRLTLTEIELVDYVDPDNTSDDLKFYPKLPGNGKLDLNPRGDFDVIGGETLTIQIDMDANKSIHIVKLGKNDIYNFRPVVFITIVTDSFVERYVKLFGEIDAIDSSAESFKLCNTDIPVITGDDEIDDSSSGCVLVTTDNTTSIFDINGKPAGFIDLVEGEPATVFGYLQRDQSPDDEVVAGGEIDEDRELHDLVLRAALIELGPDGAFLKLKGTASSGVDVDDQFTMDVDPGQGLSTPLSLTVQLQQGTILINRQGEPVASTDIGIGKLVAVRGVLDADETLFASLIIVDTDSSTQLTGSVGANPDGSCGFSLTTAGGDRSIATDADTKAFLVTGGTSSPIEVSELVADQSADVYGNENAGTGCFDAHTIIAY
jgi:Domain of unknown function (DUF4382)